MGHKYFSQRHGLNPHPNGLPLKDVVELFLRYHSGLSEAGYFTESFGFSCADVPWIDGKVRDPELDLFLGTRKKHLWPITAEQAPNYSEDDFFDVLEYLFLNVSKPISGSYHSYNDCGMHWEKFDRAKGQREFRDAVNSVLSHYDRKFQMSTSGEILAMPPHGFDRLFKAEVPTKEHGVVSRLNAAIVSFSRHGVSLDARRQAVRDLADVLEYLRPQLSGVLTSKDESDLFNIANNFGIRHHNDKQKSGYDAAIWLSWMFYFYLATIHAVLRKIESAKATPTHSAQ